MALLADDSLLNAVGDVSAVLEHDPAAVEVLDKVFIDLVHEIAEFSPVTRHFPKALGPS